MGGGWVLDASEAETVTQGLRRHFEGRLKDLEDALYGAAHGSTGAARLYVALWASLAADLVELVGSVRPDLVTRDERGHLRLAELKQWTREVLLAPAPTAAFSPWVTVAGLRAGLGLRLVAELREVVPGAVPLIPPHVHWEPWADPEAMSTAIRLLWRAVVQVVDAGLEVSPIDRVMELFGLDRTELAGLFGVTRQAGEQWQTRGMPSERWAKLAAILATGELLARKLRPGVLPGVARTKAVAYGNRTMLEVIAADEHDQLLADVRASFDWAATA